MEGESTALTGTFTTHDSAIRYLSLRNDARLVLT